LISYYIDGDWIVLSIYSFGMQTNIMDAQDLEVP
jgi:hypothetical protein